MRWRGWPPGPLFAWPAVIAIWSFAPAGAGGYFALVGAVLGAIGGLSAGLMRPHPKRG